jgi:hypothetical protein
VTRRLFALIAATVVSLAACLDANTPSAQPTPTREPEPTATVNTYALGVTVWYEGLLLHFDRATAELNELGGPVNVSLRVENPNDDLSELDAAMTLVIGDTRVEPTRESRIDSAPAKGLIGALLTFDLQGITSVDDAVVEIGAAPDHVAKVPLSPAGGKPVTFEPRNLTLKGSGVANNLKITLKSAVLREDLPDWSQELVSSLVALTVTYDAGYAGTFAGGFAFTGDNIWLQLPDGERIRARADGHSQSIELIGAKKTKAGLISRFEVPVKQLDGAFRLIVDNGAEKAIPLDLTP